MNPFDLPGPQFLVVYLVLTTVVLVCAVILTRHAENGLAPRLDFADPYRIAYLRGGENEALRVATVSLIDRGLLQVVDSSTLKARPHLVTHPVEVAILEHFRNAEAATTIFNNAPLAATCKAYRAELVSLGLLPNAAHELARNRRFWVSALVLFGVASVKLFVAYQRGRHNVLFLILMTIGALIALYQLTHPRRTARGGAVIADLRRLFDALRRRSATIPAGSASNEALLLAAVFGVGALSGASFAYVKKLFPQAQGAATSSCGSSCGASCGSSGGGCGGGGCGGGCGGCGG